MTVQPIRLFGDPVLRSPAATVETFDKELRVLVKDLTETMLKAPGAGLSANQIGVSLRVFTYDVDGEVGHLINPDLDLSSEQEEGPEGCLSLPGLVYDTPRALRTVAKGSTCTVNLWSSKAVDFLHGVCNTRLTTLTVCCLSIDSAKRNVRRP